MKISYLKLILLFLLFGAIGFFVLNLVGDTLVREVVIDVNMKSVEPVFEVEFNKPAPYWKLKDLDGDEHEISDFLGKPLVLVFWVSWNALAADQIRILDDYIAEDQRGLFNILAINNQEDRSIVDSFIKRGGYEVPILLDETGEVGEQYFTKTLPVTYFIDKEGVVKDAFIGVLDQKTGLTNP